MKNAQMVIVPLAESRPVFVSMKKSPSSPSESPLELDPDFPRFQSRWERLRGFSHGT